MPPKYQIKTFVENGYYHIFNRGVEKRKIFLDHRDYKTFLYFIKYYLAVSERDHPLRGMIPNEKCLKGKVDLLSYCLMPNHFHLLVKQYTINGISKLMKYLGTNYVMYFNKKYDRLGPLFQGIYKAIDIANESYLLHLTRYHHLNPVLGGICKSPSEYQYSSYLDYLNKRNTEWLKSKEILSFFRSAKNLMTKDILSYESFVEDYEVDSEEVLGNLTLE